MEEIIRELIRFLWEEMGNIYMIYELTLALLTKSGQQKAPKLPRGTHRKIKKKSHYRHPRRK